MKNMFILSFFVISSTGCVAMSEGKMDSVDHVADLTRDGKGGNEGGDIVKAMRSMVAGLRNLYWGDTREVYSMPAIEKNFMEENKIKMLTYGSETNALSLTQNDMQKLSLCEWFFAKTLLLFASRKMSQDMVLYTDRTEKHALLFRDYYEPRDNNFNEINHYLTGKLLGYAEEDIAFFYEKHKIAGLEEHKAEAFKLCAERGIQI